MSRKASFDRDEIAGKALQIVRKKGPEALTARSLGEALGTSPSPIFTLFGSMEEVMGEVRRLGQKRFDGYVADVADYTPAFKEFGMRVFRFARKEKPLFQYLFLSKEAEAEGITPKARECLGDICQGYGISQEQSELLFWQMWTFVCGLAWLSNQEPEKYPEERVGEMLSCQFIAMMEFFRSGRPIRNIVPHKRKKGELTILEIPSGMMAN